MTCELIYYAVGRDPALEERLTALGGLEIREGATRRDFLLALSEALGQDPVALVVGEFSALTDALSRGLGLPPTAVDWTALGVESDADALLPKGALPLLLDGAIRGLILESGPQAILALDSGCAGALFDAYLAPYLEARAAGDAPGEGSSAPAAEAPPAVPQEPAAPAVPEQTETPAPRMTDREPAYDVFAGMEDAEVSFGAAEEKPKKKHGKVWIPILCVLLVLALIAGAGWYLLLRDGGREGYYSHLMTEVYGDVGEGEPDEAFVSRYLTRFGALYQINPDVVGAISVKELHLSLPMVSSAGKGDDYYRWRRFDGTPALYGTPYTLSPYSENDVNPNLVVRGGVLFDALNDLREKGIGDVTLKTDSILYGEDTWEILSIMALDDEALAEFDNSFVSLTADQRQSRAKKALRSSEVSVSARETDLDNVGLSTSFLTLLTPCRGESGKTLVVFARRAADADFEAIWPEQQAEEEEPLASNETDVPSEAPTDEEQE